MAERVLLHAGTPKSGTTFLQSLLWANRNPLGDSGVLLPGERAFDHNRLGAALRTWRPDARRQRNRRFWDQFVDAAAAWPGTVVLSNEWIVRADAEQLRHAVTALAPAKVDVVLTARDAVAQVPAAWQESLKVGNSTSLGDFLAAMDTEGGQWTWRHLDAAHVLAQWAEVLPAGSCSVVTLPPSGSHPAVLWSRFADVLGVDPAGYDIAGVVANRSLGAEAAALLQQIGPALRAAVDADSGGWMEQYRWIRQYVGHELLLALPGHPIGLRTTDVAALRTRAQQTVTRLAEGGYHVSGELSDLSSATVPPDAVHPDDVTDSDKLAVAVALLPRLLARVRTENLAGSASQG
jgi:hypothetical protein